MIGKYILDENGEPKEVSMEEWGYWMETAQRHVAEDDIGDVWVSTVFLGLDRNFGAEGPPVLWETMIFGGEHNDYQDRYTSRESALEGHQRALRMVTDG